eukprot:TRINITY_DN2971_c0_g1_i1.p1 TRINITY_DN2971_c0_g1~~TRINITY_DN2971_c0_g1_i1.p1  ORF type:complete len:155 (-),score=27.33 TRINITY_DN2971_c0_g1_i1:171-635(-)
MRLKECLAHIQAIRQGLISVIPARFLSLLTWKELELEVCGNPVIDIELLKRHTRYSDCKPSDPFIGFFWRVLSDFNQTERSQFLRFVWGRSRLPPPGKFSEPFRLCSPAHLKETHLPISHTCNFCLELPQYSSIELMREKILKAITLCSTIDNV